MLKIVFDNKEAEKKVLDAINKGYENLSQEERKVLKANLIKTNDNLFSPLHKFEKEALQTRVLSGEARETYNGLVNIINNIYSDEIERIEKAAFKSEIEKMLNEENYDAIVVFHASFGWNIELKQRPQHLAEAMAEKKVLYIYRTNEKHDKSFSFEKIKPNLYIMNLENRVLKSIFFDELKKKSNIKKFVHVYATCLYDVPYEIIESYMEDGFKVLYDFVDELSEAISYREITEHMISSHNRLLKDKENVIVITTANTLKEVAKKVRGTDEGIVLAPNGVNLSDFSGSFKGDPGSKIKKIVDTNKTIIGYYGALASWFDYNIIIKLSEARPEYEIILIGINYDGSLDQSKVLERPNVHYLGIIDYRELIRNYANYFDVCLIPFLKNDITNSTSPIKLFEYMALGRPIVSTDIEECKKYKSALISSNSEEFIENVDEAIKLKNNNGYKDLLKKEASENTWLSRAEVIKKEMMK